MQVSDTSRTSIQVPNSHMRLVATALDRTDITSPWQKVLLDNPELENN